MKDERIQTTMNRIATLALTALQLLTSSGRWSRGTSTARA